MEVGMTAYHGEENPTYDLPGRRRGNSDSCQLVLRQNLMCTCALQDVMFAHPWHCKQTGGRAVTDCHVSTPFGADRNAERK